MKMKILFTCLFLMCSTLVASSVFAMESTNSSEEITKKRANTRPLNKDKRGNKKKKTHHEKVELPKYAYHFKKPEGSNLEMVNLRDRYDGFNPSRGTGSIGSGLYVTMERFEYIEGSDSELYQIEVQWGQNPLILSTADHVIALDSVSRNLFLYFILNNREEDQIFGLGETSAWLNYIYIDLEDEDEVEKELDRLYNKIIESLHILCPHILDFSPMIDEAETNFTEAAFSALDADEGDATMAQPINFLLASLGFSSVVNQALDNHTWGSVILGASRAILLTAILLAGPQGKF